MKTNHTNGLILKVVLACLTIFSVKLGQAQNEGIGINETGALPHISAMLDVVSTNKGVLIPRMNTAGRSSIIAPVESLQLFNTDVKCWQIYINGEWRNVFCDQSCSVAPSTPSSISGSNSVASGATGIVYGVPVTSGATSYTWAVPPGATITSGQGSIEITVDFGSGSGDVCVTANNYCGSSSSFCYSVTVN